MKSKIILSDRSRYDLHHGRMYLKIDGSGRYEVNFFPDQVPGGTEKYQIYANLGFLN